MRCASWRSRRLTCSSRTRSGGATGMRGMLPVRCGPVPLHRDEPRDRARPAVAGPARMPRRTPGTRVLRVRGAPRRDAARPAGRARRALPVMVRARSVVRPLEGARPGELPLHGDAARAAVRGPRRTRMVGARTPSGANRAAKPRADRTRGPLNAFHGGRTSRRAVRPRSHVIRARTHVTPQAGRARTLERHRQAGACRARRRRPAARRWTPTVDRAAPPGRWPPAATSGGATRTSRVAAHSSTAAPRSSPAPRRARSRRRRRVVVRQQTTFCDHDPERRPLHARPSTTRPGRARADVRTTRRRRHRKEIPRRHSMPPPRRSRPRTTCRVNRPLRRRGQLLPRLGRALPSGRAPPRLLTRTGEPRLRAPASRRATLRSEPVRWSAP